MQIQFDIDQPREALNVISIVSMVHPGMLEHVLTQLQAQPAEPAPQEKHEGVPVASGPQLVKDEPKYSQDDVNQAIQKYATRVSFPAASALLKEFGVNRATELPEEKRAEFIGRTQETK